MLWEYLCPLGGCDSRESIRHRHPWELQTKDLESYSMAFELQTEHSKLVLQRSRVYKFYLGVAIEGGKDIRIIEIDLAVVSRPL